MEPTEKEKSVELCWQWLKIRCPDIPEITAKSILGAAFGDGVKSTLHLMERVKELEEQIAFQNKELIFGIAEIISLSIENKKLREERDKKCEEVWNECYQVLRYCVDLGDGGKFNEEKFDKYFEEWKTKNLL